MIRLENQAVHVRAEHATSVRRSRQTGISVQLSFRYTLRLPTITDKTQLLQFGYDFKRRNNDLGFGGFQVFNCDTHIHQFLLTYDIGSMVAPTRTDAKRLEGARGAFVFVDRRVTVSSVAAMSFK